MQKAFDVDIAPRSKAEMRFRIEVNTLDGKLAYERDSPADALAVAEGGRESLGVRIVDGNDGKTYTVEAFRQRFAN